MIESTVCEKKVKYCPRLVTLGDGCYRGILKLFSCPLYLIKTSPLNDRIYNIFSYLMMVFTCDLLSDGVLVFEKNENSLYVGM